jgi:hypothetical protein
VTDATRILSAIEQGDSTAAPQLLPLACTGLRNLTESLLDGKQSGQSGSDYNTTIVAKQLVLPRRTIKKS